MGFYIGTRSRHHFCKHKRRPCDCGERIDSRAWCATYAEAERELASILARGAWSGLRPEAIPDDSEREALAHYSVSVNRSIGKGWLARGPLGYLLARGQTEAECVSNVRELLRERTSKQGG